MVQTFFQKKKLIIFWIILILIGVIVLIKVDLFEIEKLTFFPGKQVTVDVIPGKTAYYDDEELTIRLRNSANPRCAASSCGIRLKAIWIDGKKYLCNGGRVGYGNCGGGTSCYAHMYCDSGRYTGWRGTTYIDYIPPWGFDFGSIELPEGLTPGEHTAEGWVMGTCSASTFCYSTAFSGFFTFKFNVVARPCKIDAGQYIAGMDFGPGSVYDTNDLPNFVRLCSASPTMIVNKRTLEFNPDYTVKTKLDNNQKIIVSDDKIYKQFWISSNPLAECTEGLVYNENANICLSPGTITYCAVGEWINGGCAVKLITQCEQDTDCQIPCPGMSTTCFKTDEFTRKCQYSGKCDIQEKIIIKEKEIIIRQTFIEFIKESISNIFTKIKEFFNIG